MCYILKKLQIKPTQSIKQFGFIFFAGLISLYSHQSFASAAFGDEEAANPFPRAALLPDESGKIEINGKSQPMLWHIMDLQGDPHSSFANTDIVHFEDDTFTIVGTVLNINKDDIRLIMTDNYTYTPFYTSKIDNGVYSDFGAIIVGHKDSNLATRIHLKAIGNLRGSLDES